MVRVQGFSPLWIGSFRERRGHSFFCNDRSPFLYHSDSGVEVLVGFLPTSALGVLLQVRGSSVLIGLFLSCPLPCSPYVLGSPLVGLLIGAFRSLYSDFCRCCFLVVVLACFFVGDPRHMANSPSSSCLPPFFSLSFVPCCCLCSVRLSFCSFSGDASCCLFLFLAGVAACFVYLFCGGCAWGVLGFFVTACLTCAFFAERCPRSMHPQSVFFSLSRPLVLLLVVGRFVNVVFLRLF